MGAGGFVPGSLDEITNAYRVPNSPSQVISTKESIWKL